MSDDSVASRLVLVVEADPTVQRQLASLLANLGYEPVVTGSVAESLAALSHNRFLLSLVDLNLDGADGTELLRHLKVQGGSPGPVIVIANGGSIQRISEVAALGAEDVPQMREVREIIRQAARADVTVLICGETGTGKDLVARAIHEFGVRRAGPFVKVNCAAVPRELLESELFGHERGAFTGAHQLKLGKFESADHGTIFLDEIGDLHPALQGKLLHVLQDGQFSRVGGRSTIKVDVRVLAATNQDLEEGVAAGQFREDLFYRLNVIQVRVPPLRERSEEIPLLAEYFMQRYSTLFGQENVTLPAETVQRLLRHRFPGNVRELENVIKRIIVLGDPDLRKSPLPVAASSGAPYKISAPGRTAAISLKDVSRKAAQMAEREAMLQALEQTKWNRVQAAKLLGISYRALL